MNRRSFLNFMTTAGIAAPLAAATTHFERTSAKATKDATERILDTRTLNCGYITYAPAFMKDPNTGKMSGIFYDLTERIGELADLKINWNTETTFATFAEDIRQGKFDLHAGGIWPDVSRAKAVDFSLPTFYAGLGVYVRKDDHRFDDNTAKLNDPKFRFAAIDGEMSQIVQQSDFPNASVLGLPNNTDISMLAECLVTGKADAIIIEKVVANLYMLRNPGALRNLVDARPLRIFENTWAFAYNMPALRGVIDTAVKDMLFSGYVDKVLAKYEQVDGSFYRARLPIQ